LQIYSNMDASAVDRAAGVSKTRNFCCRTQASAGREYVPEMNLTENAQRIREEVIEHLTGAGGEAREEGSDPDAEPPGC
jgi:hypothetical protein